jgi:quinol monooxygenase YgiN
MIHVVAVITAKPGRRAEVLGHFHANVPNVHAEAGCIEYVPVVDAGPKSPWQAEHGPDTFVVVEKWETREALEAHARAPHMAAYAAKTKELVETRAIYVLSPA